VLVFLRKSMRPLSSNLTPLVFATPLCVLRDLCGESCFRRSTNQRRFRFAAGSSIAVFNGEPVRVLFTLFEAGVTIIVDVTDLMDQHVVEIEIPDRVLRPDQTPQIAVLNPAAAIHFAFDSLSRSWGSNVKFFQRCFDRIQVN
jgi:hypothetical protein